jgi:hypothetical protein
MKQKGLFIFFSNCFEFLLGGEEDWGEEGEWEWEEDDDHQQNTNGKVRML